MRVRDLQQILGKFTLNEKGTIVSDCPIYIETMDGHLEAVRKIECTTKSITSRWVLTWKMLDGKQDV